jgi:methyl-accepting chemotaxis protein
MPVLQNTAAPGAPPAGSPALPAGRRLWLLLVGTVAVAAAAVGFLSVRAAGDRAFEEMRQQGLAIARLAALAADRQDPAADPGLLRRLIGAIAADGDPAHVEIVGGDGAALAEGGNAALRPVLALRDSSSMSRGPRDGGETIRAVDGRGLYLFTYPVPGPRGGAGATPAPGRESILSPRSAVAAPRPRPAVTSAATGGEVRVAFLAERLVKARRAALQDALVTGLFVVLAGALTTRWTVRRLVIEPAVALAATAERIAGGDPAARFPRRGSNGPAAGALAGAAAAIDRLAGTLEGSLRRLDDQARRLEEVVGAIHGSAAEMASSAGEQQEALRRISTAAQAVSTHVREAAGSVGGLAKTSEETSTAIVGMAATIEDVGGLADGLTLSVNDTAATTEELVDSIKEIDRNVELLNAFVVETSQAMAHMENVLQQVERNAADSKGISEIVAQNAGHGMRAVELTIEGMEAIRGSVLEAGRVIETVGRRGQEIGLILNVIQEVTEQTNLLALNAAIIAAQAGDHGRGFAVVAEEIRELAERTATSAKEIAGLIGSFQTETGRAVAAMQEGSRRVIEGSERSREAGRALKEILESAQRSSAMVSEIAGATRALAKESQDVSASVDKVHEMTSRIKKSTAEQTQGSEQIMSAVENMREMSIHVKQSTVEQIKGARRMTRSIGEVTGMTAALHRVAADQAGAADLIQNTLGGAFEAAAAGLAAAGRVQAAMSDLLARVQVLRANLAQHDPPA